METLIIVDFQKDFCNQKGALYVQDAERAEHEIVKYIIDNHKKINDVIFTIDWHSPNHCSFKQNGGMWPNHCMQFSEGAGISTILYNTCLMYNIPIKIFKKGNVDDLEEYGAFECINHYKVNEEDIVTVNNLANNNSLPLNCFTLTVCGLAGDYCVKNTIDKLIHNNCPVKLNVQVFKNGIASIDGGTTLNNFIQKNNLKVV